MRRYSVLVLLVGCACFVPSVQAGDTPAETVDESSQVLSEFVNMAGKQIPQKLLAQAQGVVVVPNVIKVGFIAGGRRGRGVVMVRDAQGQWTLPQFLTLTGGSVGWQAGIQGTDVVLIFTSRKGVDGLLKGKFTVGVDAAVAVGPVGRNAAVATDTELKAEVYSYSRSRGLFLGASIDGSQLEIDPRAAATFYGPPRTAAQQAAGPQLIPEPAAKLHSFVAELTKDPAAPPPVVVAPQPR
jgi:SH3 domain-containing YSC84-like protein 1